MKKQPTKQEKTIIGLRDTTNNNLSLSVHKKGAVFFNLHNCEEVEITEDDDEIGKRITIEGYSNGEVFHAVFFRK